MLVESLDVTRVEALCGEKHAHGNGDHRFQRIGHHQLVEHGRDRSGMLKRECLDWRIYHAATLDRKVAAWQVHRNAADRLIDW